MLHVRDILVSYNSAADNSVENHPGRQARNGLADVGKVAAQRTPGARLEAHHAGLAQPSNGTPAIVLQTSAVSGDSTLVYFHGLPSAQSQYAAPAYSWLPA